MQIASGVSRWTMPHFGCAIGALLGALVLLVTGYSDPREGLRAPSTLQLIEKSGSLTRVVPAAQELELSAFLSVIHRIPQ